MSQSIDDRIGYLLKLYITSSCNYDEYQELLALLKIHTEPTLLEALLLEEVRNSDYHEAEQQVNWPQMLQTALQHQEAAMPAPVKRMAPFRKIAVVAAVIICMGTIAWWWLQKNNNRQSGAPAVAQSTDVMPGRNGAILTLHNGQQVVLDSAQNGALNRQPGLQIVKQDSLIAYSASAAAGKEEMAFNTLTTPRGRQFQVVLPDGSKVWLNAASSIRYPTAFTGSERTVEMTGEAYFEIKQLRNASGQKIPFVVNIHPSTGRVGGGPAGRVEVLGTHFNINAYDDEEAIKTTLLEGAVKVSKDVASVILKPGEQASISQTSHPSQPIPVQTDEVMAWKNGYFQFQRADIQTVMRQISRWYDVEIRYEGAITKDKFGGSIPRDATLSQVLHALEQSLVHFTIQGKKVIVTP